jgi:hypothetical protein
MKVPAFLIAACLGANALLAGDLTIVFKNTGKANGGTSTQYYSQDFQRYNHDESKLDVLTDFKAGVVYTIHHKDKKIEKLSWEDMAAAADLMEQQAAASKEQQDKLPAFLKKAMSTEVSVEDLGKDTVLNRKCRVYKIAVSMLEMEIAADPTLQIPVSPEAWARYGRLRGLATGGGAGGYKNLYEEMSKIKGVPLRTKTKVPIMGEMMAEAIEIKEGPIPATVFALPVGYAVEDKGKKLREQVAKRK